MDLMRRLVMRFPGLTTDWLWFGRTDGTSGETAEALGLTDVDAGLPTKIERLAACSMHADAQIAKESLARFFKSEAAWIWRQAFES
jgi:hypothetical protein